MRAKKKNKINFERKEKLIHKETMRFFNLLEIHSSTTINNQPYFPELYENVVNHIREYLSNPEFEENNLREYLDDETNKIKNFFNQEDEDKIEKSTHTENSLTQKDIEIEYTQTIFDITTRTNEIEHENEQIEEISSIHSTQQTNILNPSLNNENDQSLIANTNNENNYLKKIRNEKFSNLKVLPITKDENVDFVTLSEQPYFDKILKQNNQKKLSLLRFLKYLYIKRKRKFK